MNQCRPLLVVGTRPEAIKMAPIIRACRDHSQIEPVVCFTGQHREMLDQVAEYFGFVPDVDLNLMQPDQTLAALTARCLEGLDVEISRWQPDCVVAQGDTTSVFCASLSAFYRQVPFVHIEAGLRTNNLQSPWPEEYNRRVASLATQVHCAPTKSAASNLHAEGIDPDQVHVTGNTVIDALLWTVERERGNDAWQSKYERLTDRRVVLVTGHRRESFLSGFESICRAIQSLSTKFPETQFVYPVHLNPRVREPVFRLLAGRENVHLVAPVPYPEFVWLMDRAKLIITDSGGVQEEAPSLNKPVLVMRDTTERPEAVEAGAVELVGTSQDAIVRAASILLTNPQAYASRQIDGNPYGDGKAAGRIIDLLATRAWEQKSTSVEIPTLRQYPESSDNSTTKNGHSLSSTNSRTICVLGLGYIGLPAACVLARHGHKVVGVDVRPDVVATINSGEVHIYEPFLDELVADSVNQGRLRATLAPETADVFIICVPTPLTENHKPDLSYVRAAAQSIRDVVRPGGLIILESTCPPRTTESIVVREAIPEHLTVGKDVFIAHCPERVLPGHILQEIIENDRVVGGVTQTCTRNAAEFYEEFVTGEVLRTTAITAEMTKLFENSYRDVNIAFANELSMISNEFDADPFEIIQLANRHPRVNILSPGPGVGGHCISVDPWFLVQSSPEHTPLLRTARNVNDAKPHFVVEQVIDQTRDLESPVIGCLGLTYKADVDDLRESPSLEIVQQLIACGVGRVLACDPFVSSSNSAGISMTDLETVLEQSDILVLLTDHTEFRDLPSSVLCGKRIVDTRGTWREQSHNDQVDSVRRAA